MTLPSYYQSMIEDTFDAIMDSFYMNIKPLREEMLRVEQSEDGKIIFIMELVCVIAILVKVGI